MNVVNSKNEIDNIIKSSSMSVVYFTGKDCGACEAIKIKIQDILKRYPKIVSCEINGENHVDVCTEYGVYSLPIFLLFVENKESIRIGRNVDLLDLEKNIKRYYEMLF